MSCTANDVMSSFSFFINRVDLLLWLLRGTVDTFAKFNWSIDICGLDGLFSKLSFQSYRDNNGENNEDNNDDDDQINHIPTIPRIWHNLRSLFLPLMVRRYNKGVSYGKPWNLKHAFPLGRLTSWRRRHINNMHITQHTAYNSGRKTTQTNIALYFYEAHKICVAVVLRKLRKKRSIMYHYNILCSKLFAVHVTFCIDMSDMSLQ